jgi:hypothetical protein
VVSADSIGKETMSGSVFSYNPAQISSPMCQSIPLTLLQKAIQESALTTDQHRLNTDYHSQAGTHAIRPHPSIFMHGRPFPGKLILKSIDSPHLPWTPFRSAFNRQFPACPCFIRGYSGLTLDLPD